MARRENIDGAVPQRAKKVDTAKGVSQKAISSLKTEKEKKLAQAVVDAVFEKIENYSDYNEELAIKQIDLILGRVEGLLDDKLSSYTETEKELVKEAIVEAIGEASSEGDVPKEETTPITDTIKAILNESVSSLVFNIQTIISSYKPEKQEESVTDNKETEVLPINDEDTEKSDNETKEDEDDDSEDEDDEDDEEEKNEHLNTDDEEEEEEREEFQENLLSEISTVIQSVQNNILEEIGKLNSRFSDGIVSFGSLSQNVGGSEDSSSKKNKKKEKKVFSIVSRIQESLKNIMNFFNDLGNAIISFITKNIKKLAIALSKALFLLFLPVIGLFWLTIGPPIMLISMALFMLIMEITEHLPEFKDAISEFLVTIASAIPIIFSAIPKFFDLLIAIVGIVQTIVNFLVKELWPFLRDEIWVFIKNEIWPFLKEIFRWFVDDVYKPIIKPVMVWLANSFIKFMDEIIIPVIGKILTWFVDTFIPWVTDHILPVFAAILNMLTQFLNAIVPWLTKLVDVIFSTLYELLLIIKPVITTLAKFLAKVFIDIIKGIEVSYEFIKNKIIKPLWTFLTETLPNFAVWIWGKIKAILPWGDKGQAPNADLEYQERNDLNSVEEYQREIAVLEDKIKKLVGGLDTSSGNLARITAEEKRKAEEERKKLVQIDKGTIYAMLTSVQNIEKVINGSMIKILGLLDRFVTMLKEITGFEESPDQEDAIIGMPSIRSVKEIDSELNATSVPESDVQANGKANVAEIGNQIQNNTIKRVDGTKTNINTATISNAMNENIKNTQEELAEKIDKDKQEIDQKSSEIMSYLDKNFKDLLELLRNPKKMDIPVPYNVPQQNNVALMEA